MKKTLMALLVPFITCFSSCKEEAPDCGCDAEVRTTIPESANLIGQIAYKYQIDPNDNYYNDTYWISYEEEDCSNCIHTMIVCNESFLPQELTEVSITREMKSIKFAGHLKEICEKTFAPADYTYERIILTKIEIQ
jgi:hypothetical protein